MALNLSAFQKKDKKTKTGLNLSAFSGVKKQPVEAVQPPEAKKEPLDLVGRMLEREPIKTAKQQRAQQAKDLLREIKPEPIPEGGLTIPSRAEKPKEISALEGVKEGFELIPNFFKKFFQKEEEPLEFKVGAGLEEEAKILPGPRKTLVEAGKRKEKIEIIKPGEKEVPISPKKRAEEEVRKPTVRVGEEFRLPFAKTVKFLPKGKATIPNLASRYLEILPKVATQTAANIKTVVSQEPSKIKLPISARRLGFESDDVIDTGTRMFNKFNELQEKNPGQSKLNALEAALEPVKDVLDILLAGSQLKLVAQLGLKATKFDPELDRSLRQLNLKPDQVNEQALRDAFITRGEEIIKAGGGPRQLGELAKSTNTIIKKFGGEGIPALNKIGSSIQETSKKLLSNINTIKGLPSIGLTVEEVGLPAVISKAENLVNVVKSQGGNVVKATGILNEIAKSTSIQAANTLLGQLEGLVPEAAKEAIPQALQPLAQEAQKFETAEEFIESQPKFFHGTRETIVTDRPTRLFSTTKDKDVAVEYANGGGGYRKPSDISYLIEADTGEKYFRNDKAEAYVGEKTGKKIFFKDLNTDFKKLQQEGISDGFSAALDGARVETLYGEAKSLDLTNGNFDDITKFKEILEIIPTTQNKFFESFKRNFLKGYKTRKADVSFFNHKTREFEIEKDKFISPFDWSTTKHDNIHKFFEDIINPALEKKGFNSMIFSDDTGNTIAFTGIKHLLNKEQLTNIFNQAKAITPEVAPDIPETKVTIKPIEEVKKAQAELRDTARETMPETTKEEVQLKLNKTILELDDVKGVEGLEFLNNEKNRLLDKHRKLVEPPFKGDDFAKKPEQVKDIITEMFGEVPKQDVEIPSDPLITAPETESPQNLADFVISTARDGAFSMSQTIQSDAKTPLKNKVGMIDYIRTPDRVLKKIGLGKEAEILREKYDAYLKELPKNIDKVTQWRDRVPSDDSNLKIFQFLDGGRPSLTPTEKEVAIEIQDWLAKWADRLDLPEDNRIAKYITHLFDDQLIKKEFDEDLAKIIADKIPGSTYDPFLQKRLGIKGYKQDTWKALDAYVKRATRKVHMDVALNRLKNKEGTLETSQWNFVKKFVDNINMRPTDIDNLLDNSIKQLVGYKFGQRPVANISRSLRQMTYRAMLGLNLSSALRNISQGVNTYAKLGEKYTALGYMKLFSTGARQELLEQGVLDAGFIEDRLLSSTKKKLQKFDKVLFSFFEGAERINRGSAYFGAKAKALSKGKTEEEAIKIAKKLVRDTQFAFGSIDRPVMLQSDIAKTLGQFQSFTTKQIEFLTEMGKNKEFAGLIRYAVAGLVFVSTIGRAFGMEPKELIPAWRIGAPPSLKFPIEIGKALLNVPDKFGNKRDLSKKAKDVGSSLIGLFPAGLQIKKTVQGVKAVREGGAFTKAGRHQFDVGGDAFKNIQAALFGKFAGKGAKEFFDKKPKKKSRIERIEEQINKRIGDRIDSRIDRQIDRRIKKIEERLK